MLAIAALACSGGDEATSRPTETETPRPPSTATPNPTTPNPATETTDPTAAHKPTTTPVPTIAYTPTIAHTPTFEPTPAPTLNPLKADSCFNEFLTRVTTDERKDEIRGGNPAAQETQKYLETISIELLASRPDCKEEGWSPKFSAGESSFDRVDPCKTGNFGGYRVHYPLQSQDGRIKPTFVIAGNTEDEEYYGGMSLLVHFSKLPYSDGSGCWYWTSRGEMRISITTPDGEYHSTSYLGLPDCESKLREVIEDFRNEGRELGAEAVRDAQMRVMDAGPKECKASVPRNKIHGVDDQEYLERQWRLTPSETSTDGCDWKGNTGILDDGGFLINWDMTPSQSSETLVTDSRGGSPCWLLSKDGEWLYSEPVTTPVIYYLLGLAFP